MYRRERFTLLRGGKPVAEVSPVPLGLRLGDLPELLENVPSLGPDEADALSAEIQEARNELDAHPPGDPWDT